MQKLRSKVIIKFAEGIAMKIKSLNKDEDLDVFDFLSEEILGYFELRQPVLRLLAEVSSV